MEIICKIFKVLIQLTKKTEIELMNFRFIASSEWFQQFQLSNNRCAGKYLLISDSEALRAFGRSDDK